MSAKVLKWRGNGLLPKKTSKRRSHYASHADRLAVAGDEKGRHTRRLIHMQRVSRTIGRDWGQYGRSRAAMDFQARASKLGVNITREEAEFLQRRVLEKGRRRIDGTTKITYNKYHRYVKDRNLEELEREGILEAIEQPEGASEATKKLIPIIGIVGTISWAITGTQLAGECGMNFFGCAFVGGVSSLGGGKCILYR